MTERLPMTMQEAIDAVIARGRTAGAQHAKVGSTVALAFYEAGCEITRLGVEGRTHIGSQQSKAFFLEGFLAGYFTDVDDPRGTAECWLEGRRCTT